MKGSIERKPLCGGRHWAKRRGMSLVEAVIALSLLAIIALSFTQSILHARQSSQSSAARLAAQATAVSYMEQIMGLPYGYLRRAAENDSFPIEVVTGANERIALRGDSINEDTAIAFETRLPGRVADREMPVGFELEVTEIQDLDVVQIALTYHWKDPATRRPSTGTLLSIRSPH